jgi:peptidoglycan/LPS O-acetylase OafA/YrhL/lysophospholipase L1-like esterase
MRYEPTLDGIRALAVLAVMGYHARVEALRGGFIGVDVFFVLSGYLITALLVAEHARTGRIAVRAFYARRARRLLPALLLLLLGVAAYSSFVASPGDRGAIRADALASLFYVQNWHLIWSGSSYFAAYAAPSPLRHLWSLAIEEQFYLVWPLTLLLLLRVVKARTWLLVGVMGAAAVASAALMARIYHPAFDPSRVYYGTDTRAFELLIGALLAVVLRRVGSAITRAGEWLEVAGLGAGAVLVAVAVRTSDTSGWPYRGGFLMIALCTAVVVASVVHADTGLLRRLLSWSPLRATGRISYGLYLWHWPVFLWLDPDHTGWHGTGLLAIRFAATFTIAVISYAVVERPIRSGVSPIWRGRRLGAVTVVAVAAVVVAVSLSVPIATTAPQTIRFSSPAPSLPPLPGPTTPTTTALERIQTATRLEARPSAWESGDLRIQADGRPLAFDRQFLPALDVGDGRPHILMVGDSVLVSLTAAGFDPRPISRADYYVDAEIGCGFLPGLTTDRGRTSIPFPGCGAALRETRWRMLVDRRRPDISFLLVGAYEVFDNVFEGQRYRVGTAAYATRLRDQLLHDVDLFSSRGGLVALPTVPCFDPPDFHLAGVIQDETDRRNPRRVSAVNAVLREVARARPKTVRLVDLAGFLCPDGHPRDRIDGVTMRSDGIHFTAGGATIVSRWLAPRLEALVPPGPVFASVPATNTPLTP